MVDKIRNIAVYPHGETRMELWGGTGDREWFVVRSLKRGKPYVKAYGVKHYLTEREAIIARQFAGVLNMKGE